VLADAVLVLADAVLVLADALLVLADALLVLADAVLVLAGAARSRAMPSRARRRSSWWPGEGPAAEKVPVDVRNGLARVGAGVEDDAIAALADPFRLCDAVHPGDHLAEQPAVRGGQRRDVGKVLLRDDEHMRRGLRVDIAEGQDPVRFKHRGRGNFASHDGAEQAFSHTKILGPPVARLLMAV
jgi:hypothetical protein